MQQALNLNIRLVDGTRFSTMVRPGANALASIKAYGVPVKVECVEAGTCSGCHVRIPREWQSHLAPPSEQERALLESVQGADETSRLLCQIVMNESLNGLEVELQPDSLQPQTYWVAG